MNADNGKKMPKLPNNIMKNVDLCGCDKMSNLPFGSWILGYSPNSEYLAKHPNSLNSKCQIKYSCMPNNCWVVSHHSSFTFSMTSSSLMPKRGSQRSFLLGTPSYNYFVWQRYVISFKIFSYETFWLSNGFMYWSNIFSSVFQMWEKMFVPMHCLNFGIGGDQTQNVLWRLQNGELENLAPKVSIARFFVVLWNTFYPGLLKQCS